MTEPVRRTSALLALVVLALLASADGVYLTLVHVDYATGHKGLSMVCHALTDAGCSVTAGRFGSVFGIPVATIGFAGAVATLVLALGALRRRDQWEDPQRSVLLLLAGASVLASAVMGTLSTIEGSFCPFCLAWYVLNVGLLAAAWRARNRGMRVGDVIDDALGSAGLTAMVVFCVALVAATFAHNQRRDELVAERERVVAEHADEIADEIVAEVLAVPPVAVEPEGAPSKGPADAEVDIVEFGDFECPHCRKLWASVESWLESTDHTVRVRFVDFPLDSACNSGVDKVHPHACGAAIAAECAHRQEAFWPYADALFADQGALERDDLVERARTLELDIDAFTACLDDPSALAHVRADADLGQQLEIRATPTFYVNGHAIKGALPPPVFAAVVEKLLARSQSAQ